jgi:hypothetical protein
MGCSGYSPAIVFDNFRHRLNAAGAVSPVA